MEFLVRAAKTSDDMAVAGIIQEWGAATPWMAPLDDLEPMAASWRDLLASDTAWVAENAGDVLGFCVREDDNITGLYVAGAAQGQGVGKALLDRAKEGRDWITIWVYEKNIRARAFYRREGAVELEREKDEHSDLIYVHSRWTRA